MKAGIGFPRRVYRFVNAIVLKGEDFCKALCIRRRKPASRALSPHWIYSGFVSARQRRAPAHLIQLVFDRGFHSSHRWRMQETHESPREGLIAAVFCTIIGLIAYAGYALH